MPALSASDGLRLEYTVSGPVEGPAVVLLAGFKAAATSWVYQQRALTDAGFRVFSVDLRGHGAAEKSAPGTTMARRGEDVHDVLTHLDLHSVALVGGSMGGNTIWAYLEQFGTERIGSIVIVDQTPKMLNSDEWKHGFYGYTEANRDTMFAAGIPSTGHGTPIVRRGMRLVRLLRAMDLRKAERGYSPAELDVLGDHARKDWRPQIAAANVPILFVAGKESEVWPSTHAAAAALLNPFAGSAVIKHAGHATNIEQPQIFNRLLVGFLRGL
jgi:non-heme chloroperoxidase